VREQLHDAIQALAVKKTALKQKAAAHDRRGAAAYKGGQLAAAKDEARRKLLALKHMGVVSGLQANLEHIYEELDVLHSVEHAYAALKCGSAALEQTLQQIDLGRMGTLLDTIDEQLTHGQDAGALLAKPMGALALVDEDDAELTSVLEQWQAAPEPPTPAAPAFAAPDAPAFATPARVALLN
jgi:hypothetical protein